MVDKLENPVCGSSSCRWNRLDLYCTVICVVTFAVTLAVVFSITPAPGKCDYVTIVPRVEWGAREAKSREEMNTPVSTVFIHHTSRERCFTDSTCKETLRNVQTYHMTDNGWDDIGYNFLVGENGWVYEARGWTAVGAHTLSWNAQSISIAILGDFNTTLPHKYALKATQNMISCGIASGHISSTYNLYGHSDATRPGSDIVPGPGNALYNEIKKWGRFDAKSERPVVPSNAVRK